MKTIFIKMFSQASIKCLGHIAGIKNNLLKTLYQVV